LNVNKCFKEYAASIFGNEENASVKLTELLHAGFLLGLLFNPEDGSNMFLATSDDFHLVRYIQKDKFLMTQESN
jgi:hypothetical protein